MLSFKLLGLHLALSALPPVLAQNGTALQAEAVMAHFGQSGLVPSVLETFTPNALLRVSLKGLGNITIGQHVSREQALYAPDLSLTAINASTLLHGPYTIIMIDAGPPGADQGQGQRRHWLVNNVIDPASLPAAGADVSMLGATIVTRYIPPNPPVGNGPHRYVLLVFTQPADFLPPSDLFRENTGGGIFVLNNYAKSTRLGPVVAASYFTCQRGPTTASLPLTSPVISATLPGWTGGAVKPTETVAVAQKANSGPSTTHNTLALFLAPIMGFLAL